MQRIGVFVCHCGTNIAATVDVKKVVEMAAKEPGVVHAEDYQYMCSEAGQAKIINAIHEKNLTGIVVCSCSPRMHEATFRKAAAKAGLNPYMVEIANIREHCSWIHKDMEEATLKAVILARAAVAKVNLNAPLQPGESRVTKRALIIGGGIAGIQTAAVIVADENIRHRVITGLETDNLAETNVFAADAAAAAYSEGGEWLDDLREYLWENRQFAEKFIKERIPQIKPVESDATYLMWLDCTDIASDSDGLKDFICERSGLYVSSGSAYRSNGGFLRFNIACPQKMLEDGLKRLEKSVKEWKCS